MAMINGTGGTVTFATGYTAGIQEWTIRYSAEVLENTIFGGTTRSFIAGMKNWEGSYTCWLDDTTALVAPGAAGANATFQYHAGRTLSGSIIVTSIEPTANYDGSSRFVTVNFQGSSTCNIT